MAPQESALLRQILADPRGLPEQLALFAVRHRGEAARRTVADLPPEAEQSAKYHELIRRGRRATTVEGAFVGGPFLLFVPFAFCAALLRQSRTLLELAALDGRDPTETERAAELLVLQGVYADVGTARAALDAHRPRPPVRRLHLTTLWDLTVRMARLLGLITPAQGSGGRYRWLIQGGRWLLLGVVFLAGQVAPLVWLPYMGVSYDRATVRLMDRAVRFYFADAPMPVRGRGRLDPGALAAAGGVLLSLLAPVALAVGLVVADVRIAGGHWPVLVIALTAVSVAVGAVWQWRRRRSDRAREAASGTRDSGL